MSRPIFALKMLVLALEEQAEDVLAAACQYGSTAAPPLTREEVAGLLTAIATDAEEPREVGVWLVGTTPEGDLIKWGRSGDTKWPFFTRDEALGWLPYLERGHPDFAFWLLFVFNNGQLRTEELP